MANGQQQLDRIKRKQQLLRVRQKQALLARSKAPSAAETVETAARSALSGATAGLSEPVISGAVAAGRAPSVSGGEFLPGGTAALTGQAAPFAEQQAARQAAMEQAFAEDVARRRQLQERLPDVTMGAEIAGTLAGGLVPVGPAAATFRAGQAAARGIQGAGLGARLGRGAVTGGVAGAGFEATRQAALEPTGFVDDVSTAEGGIAGAVAGAAFPAAGAALRAAGRGVAAGSRGAMTAAFGIRGDAISKFIQRADAIKKAKSLEQISDEAKDAIANIRKEAEGSRLDLVDSVQEALDGLKQKTVQASRESFEILEGSGVKVRKNELIDALSRAKSSQNLTIAGKKPVGAAAKTALRKLDTIKDDLSAFPDDIDATQVKRILQQLDDEFTESALPGVFEENRSQRAIKAVRKEIDQVLKKKVPSYEEKMQEVRALTEFTKESAKALAGQEKAFGNLGKVFRPGRPIKNETIKNLLESSDDLRAQTDRFRIAQENADLFKTWNDGSVESKIKSLMTAPDGQRVDLRRSFQRLSELSDEQFVQAIDDLSVARQFEQEFLRGSRNVNMWTVLGGASGAGIGGGFLGGGIGAAVGGVIDKFGPKIAKSILSGVASIRGMPTVQKIRSLEIPDKAKKELERTFVQSIARGQEESGPVRIPPTQRPLYRVEINRSDSISDLDKAKALTELNSKGTVPSGLTRKLMLGGEVQAAEYEMPDSIKPPQPAKKMSAEEFIKNRRPQKY